MKTITQRNFKSTVQFAVGFAARRAFQLGLSKKKFEKLAAVCVKAAKAAVKRGVSPKATAHSVRRAMQAAGYGY